MLIKFKVKNFKSFKEETILDMTKVDIDNDNEDFIKSVNDIELLSTAVIYGANASGKSNLIEALQYMCNITIKGIDSEEVYNIAEGNIPFYFESNYKTNPIEFEIDFIVYDKEFRYGLILKDEGIVKEYAYIRKKTSKNYSYDLIFERDLEKNILKLSNDLTTIEKVIEKLSNKKTIISLSNDFETEYLSSLHIWIRHIDIKHSIDFIVKLKRWHTFFDIMKFENVENKLLKFLHSFEETITGVEFVEDKSKNELECWIERTINNEIYKRNYVNESKGTLKMISIFFMIQSAIKIKKPILVFDELDQNIHPLLLRRILLTAKESVYKENEIQIITTLHDTSILNYNILREDEIWFVEKNKNLESELYSMVELDNLDISKNTFEEYLYGEYGGIPNIKGFDFFE